jgi:hypothetical protein
MKTLCFKVNSTEYMASKESNSFGDQLIKIAEFNGSDFVTTVDTSYAEGEWIDFDSESLTSRFSLK